MTLKQNLIKFKPSFFVLAAFSVVLGVWKYFTAVFVLLFLHELCHIFTAGLWGLGTSGITVTPIGIYADINGLERLHIAKRISIAAAGPFFNLFLCLFCRGPIRDINFALALFNLLPVYPLDGGKIFHYTVSYFIGVLRGNMLSVKLGMFLSVVMVGAGMVQLVLYPPNISLFCLGMYFYKFGQNSTVCLTYNFYKTIINKQENRIIPVRPVSVSENLDIKAVLYRLGWDYHTLVYIRGTNIVTISEESILEYITKHGLRGKIGDILFTNNSAPHDR